MGSELVGWEGSSLGFARSRLETVAFGEALLI